MQGLEYVRNVCRHSPGAGVYETIWSPRRQEIVLLDAEIEIRNLFIPAIAAQDIKDLMLAHTTNQ